MQQAETYIDPRFADLPCFGDDAKHDWRIGPASPVVGEGGAHVWRIKLDGSWSRELELALTLDDRIRASRFRFEVDRQRFRAARASLRTILSRYVGMDPADLEFAHTVFGKPSLLAKHNRIGLRFNLSHSHNLALLAVTRDSEVGIDIEFMNQDFAGLEIAERFFSRAEVAELKSVAPELSTRAFFTCWTRKEAYIKARGEGLSLPLDQFDMSLAPGSRPVMLANRDPAEVFRWAFRDLLPEAGYAAALAIETSAPRLQLYSLAEQ